MKYCRPRSEIAWQMYAMDFTVVVAASWRATLRAVSTI